MAPQSSFFKTADFQDGFRRQLHSAVFCTACVISTTCFFALLVVALLSSKVKVKRTYTSSVVAIVQNILTDRDWSTIELPRNAMATFNGNSIPHRAVSVVIQTSLPYPTSVSFHDLTLESFEQTLARWSKEDWKDSAPRMTTATAAVPEAVVLSRSVESEVLQANTQCIITQMAHAHTGRNRAIKIEPNPFGGSKVITVLSKRCATSAIGASSPVPAIANGGARGRHRPSAINVLVESENGVYELGRHSVGLSMLCLAASSFNDWMLRLSQIAVTIAS